MIAEWLEKAWTQTTPATVLAGGAGVAISVIGWLATAYSTRSLEDKKSQIKRREWLADKEFEAVQAFLAFRMESIPPSVGDLYGADERSAEVVTHFDKIEKSLRTFMAAHGAVLPPTIRQQITDCYGRFLDKAGTAVRIDGTRAEPSPRFVKVGSDFIAEIGGIERDLYKLVRGDR